MHLSLPRVPSDQLVAIVYLVKAPTMVKIKKGLNVPIAGEPRQIIDGSKHVTKVAVLSDDYLGMKPSMLVAEGDIVKKGQALFADKRYPKVLYTAPAAGRILAVNRGEKRRFRSAEIELQGSDEVTFTNYGNTDLTRLTREQVLDNLLASGLFTAIRQRPFSKIPNPNSTPHSLFITAIDTNPHAPDVNLVIGQHQSEFLYGLQVLRHLTDGPTYLCKGPAGMLPGQELDTIQVRAFDGPHPAGLPGTHIHFLDPVSDRKSVWYINYQDVIAVGHLFVTGKLLSERVVSLAGPTVKNPRLLKTILGASILELTAGELDDCENRVISGSVLSGRQILGANTYLGRYHLQISALKEGRQRDFLGWQAPGFNKFSIKKVFASAMMPGRKFEMTTSTEGSKRAMVPVGSYEEVMPMDILPTFLLRALLTNDSDQAARLGALELDEEDLALCTFVCPGKTDYGPILRDSLTRIEVEG